MAMRTKGAFGLLLITLFGATLIGCERPSSREAVELYAQGRYREALPKLIDGAGRRDPVANYFLARMYERGDGVEADSTKAMNLYMSAANEGLKRAHAAVAAYQLVNRIDTERQLGILANLAETDPESALSWYCEALHQLSIDERSEFDYSELFTDCVEKLREIDEATAFRLLSSAYAGGIGVDKDPARSLSYAEQAAAAGDVRIQSSLAYAYFEGIGKPSDLVRAYAHTYTALVLAGKDMSTQRRSEMETLIRLINRRMSAGQLAAGKALAEQVRKDAEQRFQAWRQRHQIDWALKDQPQ